MSLPSSFIGCLFEEGLSNAKFATLPQKNATASSRVLHAMKKLNAAIDAWADISREMVEDAYVDLVKWVRKQWMGICQEDGFNALKGWSIKEISQDTSTLTLLSFARTLPALQVYEVL
ncbi:hypothetical protein HD554DRAFT_2038330 [Boletus coccyginus]|nr:hypothetical protein HD554DRAFT_2038330 [Boletus coccyginus]